jgi:hypothetical protein
MKLNRHAKFIAHMLVLFVLMMAVSIGIEMRYYAQLIIWGLFAYIIAKDVIDYFRCERQRQQCEKDQAKIAEVMRKLDSIKKQLEGTV